MNAVTETLSEWRDTIADFLPAGGIARPLGVGLVLYLLVAVLVGIYWSFPPGEFDVEERAAAYSAEEEGSVVTGSATGIG